MARASDRVDRVSQKERQEARLNQEMLGKGTIEKTFRVSDTRCKAVATAADVADHARVFDTELAGHDCYGAPILCGMSRFKTSSPCVTPSPWPDRTPMGPLLYSQGLMLLCMRNCLYR